MEKNELTNYEEILENLDVFGFKYKQIYEANNQCKEYLKEGDIKIHSNSSNGFIIFQINGDKFGIFFIKPKKINYKKLNKSQELVFSSFQIDEFMKKNSIEDLLFKINERTYHYNKQKFSLLQIESDSIDFTEISSVNLIEFKLNYDTSYKKELPPTEFSYYFYEYFEYNKKDEKFYYYETQERNKLMKKLTNFYFSDLNFFQFCGPISGGKSTTLLMFRNILPGIIYFNLQVIMQYYLGSNNTFKSIMSYELARLRRNIMEEKIVVEKVKKIFEEQVFEHILIKIIELLLEINIRNIIILDQFKVTYLLSDIFNLIKKKISKTCIGLIISSSIDEKDIKDNLQKTLNKFKGMPNEITNESQEYYFYVPNLLNISEIREKIISNNKISIVRADLYEQFSFKTRYISKLEKNEKELDKGIKLIDEEIKKKIINQFNFSESVSFEIINLLINKFINRHMEYNVSNISSLINIPLKFIDAHFDDKYFYFHYGFPYVQTLLENSKKNLDSEKYFGQKLFREPFYSQFKGTYFEDAVICAIEEGKIKYDKTIKNKEIFKIFVNNILDLEEVDKQSNAHSIINKIKNKGENSSEDKFDFNEYIKENIEKINTQLGDIKDKIKEEEKNIYYFYQQSLNEKLEKLNREVKEYETIIEETKDKKKLPKKYTEQIVKPFNEKFKNGDIIIRQIQITGKCLDSALLFGNKDEKTLVCLQMKFYDPKTPLSSEDRNGLQKSFIKTTCKSILSNLFLKFDIRVEKWYYILILHLDYEAKSYNTNFVKICKDNDIEYLFYDPNKNKFYDKEIKPSNEMTFNFLSNLDYEEKDSNPYICFRNDNIIESFLKKRNSCFEKSISPEIEAKRKAKEFEQKYNISFDNFFTKIKEKYKDIKQIKIKSALEMDMNKDFPPLNTGYGMVFLNTFKNGLIFEGKYGKNDKFITFDSQNNETILLLKIYSHINIEEKFTFFVVKLTSK